jgi:hypothetical protein
MYHKIGYGFLPKGKNYDQKLELAMVFFPRGKKPGCSLYTARAKNTFQCCILGRCEFAI